MTVWDRTWRRATRTPEEIHDRSKAYVEACWRAVQGMLPPRPIRFLDAGCGPGFYVRQAIHEHPDTRATGCDRSLEAVVLANYMRDAPGARFLASDVTALPFRDDSFDAVLCQGVLCYLSHREVRRALLEMARVLSPGGVLLLGMPNALCIPHTVYKVLRADRYEYGRERSYSPWGLARLLERHGFRSITTAGYFPAYGLLRLASRTARATGRLLHATTPGLDRLMDGRFSDTFGFYLIAAGVKP